MPETYHQATTLLIRIEEAGSEGQPALHREPLRVSVLKALLQEEAKKVMLTCMNPGR
jgi:hypothetical protein